MQILLCAATPLEVQPTIDFLREKGLESRVKVVITGVGLMAATYSLTRAMALQKPYLAIQGGIAGAFGESLPLGQTVAVQEDTIGDLGVQEGPDFRSLFDLGLCAPHDHPWKGGGLINPHQDLLQRTGLPIVKGVTVNEISTLNARMTYYNNGLGAAIESMEGAAFHYVALQEGIPFLQLRSVSNRTGERDKSRWKLAASVKALNYSLQEIILKLLNT